MRHSRARRDGDRAPTGRGFARGVANNLDCTSGGGQFRLNKEWEAILQTGRYAPVSSGLACCRSRFVFEAHSAARVSAGPVRPAWPPNLVCSCRIALATQTPAQRGRDRLARWDWDNHLNVATTLTRDHHADVFAGQSSGTITWIVRPVGEVFYEEEFGQSQPFPGCWSDMEVGG